MMFTYQELYEHWLEVLFEMKKAFQRNSKEASEIQKNVNFKEFKELCRDRKKDCVAGFRKLENGLYTWPEEDEA